MMSSWAIRRVGLVIVLLILSPIDARSEDRHANGFELLRCEFDEVWDANYDGWPDNWQRRTDENYPSYVRIEIADDGAAPAGRSLQVHLNGGTAHVETPVIPVAPLYSYLLTAKVRLERVEDSPVSVGIHWQDSQGATLGTSLSTALSNTKDSQEIRIGPESPAGVDAQQAIIFVRVDRGQRIDLDGIVVIESVRFIRLPQVVLLPRSPLGLFESPQDVAVTCRLTGIPSPQPQVRFELRSVEDELVKHEDVAVKGATPVSTSSIASSGPAAASQVTDYQGEVTWKPGDIGHGFYRVHATLLADGIEGAKLSTPIVVLRPMSRSPEGTFGASLASVTDPLGTDQWMRLLSQLGVHWVKFPVWYDLDEEDLGDELVQFTEQLATLGIDVVGVVDRPPKFDSGVSGLAEAGSIADILSLDASYWLPSLDPIVTRLSLRIRWWQFGGDRDSSLVGYPDLADLFIKAHQQLYRFGQKVNIGIPWKWMAEPPFEANAPWQFVQWTAEPPMTGRELASNLDGRAQDTVQSWVLIEPLPRDGYNLEVRVADLIQQMLACRNYGADAAFLTHPIDSSRGVLDDLGAPDELFLPFRTTAMLVGNAEYLGSIRLPSESQNHIFRQSDGTVFMVIWSSRSVTETLYLGEEIHQFDPWGREIPLGGDAAEQVITVSRIPTFVTGLNEPVARIRANTAFEETRIPSVSGKPQANALTFVNSFPQGVGGTVMPVVSDALVFGPIPLQFKSAAGAEVRMPFEITPKFNVSSGRQDVRLDFEIQSSPKLKFSVWRHVDVGLGDIEIEVSTSWEEDGTLVIEQRTLNHTDELVDFKCLLYVSDRKRQRNHVVRLGRGQDLQYYRFPNGRELIGDELLLRAEEIGGPRVLNYRFYVEY